MSATCSACEFMCMLADSVLELPWWCQCGMCSEGDEQSCCKRRQSGSEAGGSEACLEMVERRPSDGSMQQPDSGALILLRLCYLQRSSSYQRNAPVFTSDGLLS